MCKLNASLSALFVSTLLFSVTGLIIGQSNVPAGYTWCDIEYPRDENGRQYQICYHEDSISHTVYPSNINLLGEAYDYCDVPVPVNVAYAMPVAGSTAESAVDTTSSRIMKQICYYDDEPLQQYEVTVSQKYTPTRQKIDLPFV